MSDLPALTPQDAIDVLNRIHTADPTVLVSLVHHRVPCNTQLAEDETVQVGRPTVGDGYEVGLLGILNGIFGDRGDGKGWIASVYDGPRLVRFALNVEASPKEAA